MKKSRRLMVIAGGTGGHVFPGLVVARYLMEQGWKVRWLGTTDRIEADLVPKYGIEISFISITSMHGKGIKVLLLAAVHLLSAWRKARAIMKFFRPDVVLAMGGYVCGPSGLAAWSLGIPVVLHEQNSIAGFTNKWLSKISRKVMQGFSGSLPKAKVVGNPVRMDILALPSPEARLAGRKGPVRILVLGGSQGATILNQIIPQVAEKLGNIVTVWHQSGKGALQKVEKAYAGIAQFQYKVTEFIEDIAAAYAWADVVVCRAGAMTVSEISAVGLPALFVPFQHKDRHQYWNALPLEKAGVAKIFEQQQFTVDAVITILKSWNRTVLLDMAKRARTVSISIPNSTEKIAKELDLVINFDKRSS